MLATLPLAPGYAATFRILDLQTQQVKVKQLAVAGTEQGVVPAGTFDAYKVEVTSADGGGEKMTLWVDKESRRVVKTVTTVPQLGGAVITTELTQ